MQVSRGNARRRPRRRHNGARVSLCRFGSRWFLVFAGMMTILLAANLKKFWRRGDAVGVEDASSEHVDVARDLPIIAHKEHNESLFQPEYRTVAFVQNGQCSVSVCRTLITGCGRSGTHFIADQLMSAGIPIKHEQIGEAGTVSWIHAASYREELAELEEWFSDAESVTLRGRADFRFYPVIHMVRHPLAAISSLTECFCGCGSMACGTWADRPSWKWAGKFVEFSERECASNIAGEVCKYHKGDGRLIRSMEYWLQWNQLASSQAQWRVQLETVDLVEVLKVVPGLNTLGSDGREAISRLDQKPFSRRSASRRRRQVSWDDMGSADPLLESQIWEMARSYGYSREEPRPQ